MEYKKKYGKGVSDRFSIRLPGDLKEDVERVAVELGISRNELITRILGGMIPGYMGVVRGLVKK